MLQLKQYKPDLTRLCTDSKAVKRLYFFGSALTPRFNQDSDIDVLVETADIPAEEKGDSLLKLWNNLEELFNRKVDLLTADSLHNPFLKHEIERTKRLVYDGQTKQIFV